MAVNPMQRKARNSFLLGMIITLLITGVVIVLLFFQLKKKNEELKAEIGEKRQVYVLSQDVKSGQILTEDMFVTKQINVNEIPVNATSMSDVVSSWFLQTEKGYVLYRDEFGLYYEKVENDPDSVDSIIELYSENGQYYMKSNDEPVTLRVQPIEVLVNNETMYLVKDTNSIDEDTRVYEDYSTGNCYIYKINDDNTVSKEYIKFNTVPLLSKIDLKANTVMTRDYVVQSDSIVTKDMREQEYNMIVLPMDLETNDYVDIRLMLPNGQNFIVISKTQVEVPVEGDGITAIPDTIRINLREDEILSLSSAIVEAYGLKGAYLYANKYVEAGMQDPAIPNYTPNEAVTRLIQTNPNIVEIASAELAARYSDASKGNRNDYIQSQINNEQSYDTNVQSGLEESANNSLSTRQEYLKSLGY